MPMLLKSHDHQTLKPPSETCRTSPEHMFCFLFFEQSNTHSPKPAKGYEERERECKKDMLSKQTQASPFVGTCNQVALFMQLTSFHTYVKKSLMEQK